MVCVGVSRGGSKTVSTEAVFAWGACMHGRCIQKEEDKYTIMAMMSLQIWLVATCFRGLSPLHCGVAYPPATCVLVLGYLVYDYS